MIFDRVAFNVLDGKYYIKDEGTPFDRFLNMFDAKKFYQKILYRGMFSIFGQENHVFYVSVITD